MQNPQTIFATQPQVVLAEEEIDLQEIIYKYFLSHWYLYVLGILVGGGLAYAYLLQATPVYEVKSKILIRQDDNQSFSAENMVLDNFSLFGTSENVANEIQLLKSNSLMNQVVSQLNLSINYNWKYYLKTIPLFTESPILADSVQLSDKAVYSEDYRLRSGIVFDLQTIDFQYFNLMYKERSIGKYAFGELIENDLGKFRFALNEPKNLINDSTLQITFADPELVSEKYQEKFKVSLVDEDATMLELRLEEEHPKRGIMILDALVNIYNEGTVDDKNQIAQSTLAFINDRLGNLAKELSSVEGSVERYKKRNEITTEVASDLGIVMGELSKYTDEQTDLEVQLSILQSMGSFLGTSPTAFDLIPANLTGANAALADLIAPYNEMVLKRQLLLETAKASNPLVQTNTNQLISLRETIRTTIRNLTQDLSKKLKSVEQLTGDLAVRLKKVPTQERGLMEIKRQQVIKENLYLYLLQKREEMALSVVATEANSKVVDIPKSSREEIKPKKAIVLLGGIFSGLFLPFFFVLGKSLFQNTIESEEDLKELTKVPLIGSINKSTDKSTIVVKNNSRTAISERFRLIRTNLSFSNKKKSQTILITSSVSGEGKSFTAINLAASFALTRKKTILIELDLRKPKLKRYLDIGVKDIGITNYLVGNSPLEDVVNFHPEFPDLHFITSGPIPHNPNELLSEKSVVTMFQELKNRYDVIIVDTPPAGLVSDAFLLNEFVDNSIYVVRAAITKKGMIEGLDELQKSGKLKSMSVLLNGVGANGGYGYRRYGYGGGQYGYGYFEN